MADLYVALVEVRPEKGCELVDADVVGAFARCYAVARNAPTAEKGIRTFLARQGFAVVGAEFCRSCRGSEWENPDSPEAEACMQEAEETGEVVLGRLDTWTDED